MWWSVLHRKKKVRFYTFSENAKGTLTQKTTDLFSLSLVWFIFQPMSRSKWHIECLPTLQLKKLMTESRWEPKELNVVNISLSHSLQFYRFFVLHKEPSYFSNPMHQFSITMSVLMARLQVQGLRANEVRQHLMSFLQQQANIWVLLDVYIHMFLKKVYKQPFIRS